VRESVAGVEVVHEDDDTVGEHHLALARGAVEPVPALS
jgi:hypothetical protein